MKDEIIIVSGLPRSGTSLMMQVMDAGGIDIVTDNVRTADADNPRGYHELERVKRVKEDCSWLPEARGKAVKVVSQLLPHLPATERYRVVFMDRDLTETLDSQERMLRRLGRPTLPRTEKLPAFSLHLDRIHRWLARQPHITAIRVCYASLVEQPEVEVARVDEFLGGRLAASDAVRVVEPALYRNRTVTPTRKTS